MCKCDCCVRYGPLPERRGPPLANALAEYRKMAIDEDKKRVCRVCEKVCEDCIPVGDGKRDGTAAG